MMYYYDDWGETMLLKEATKLPRSLPAYRSLACPYNGRQVSFCRGLCAPIAGVGACGRLAPHAMLGRTQLAIARYNALSTNT